MPELFSERRLILVRHAHRDKVATDFDNGLSEKGEKQAKRLSAFFTDEFAEEKSLLLLTSPRKRCRETLEPLAKSLKRNLDTNLWLEEGGPLGSKIRGFLKEWSERRDRVTIACSHGDWIPTAVEQECGARIICRKSSFIDLVDVGGEFLIHRIIQRV